MLLVSSRNTAIPPVETECLYMTCVCISHKGRVELDSIFPLLANQFVLFHQLSQDFYWLMTSERTNTCERLLKNEGFEDKEISAQLCSFEFGLIGVSWFISGQCYVPLAAVFLMEIWVFEDQLCQNCEVVCQHQGESTSPSINRDLPKLWLHKGGNRQNGSWPSLLEPPC